MIPSESPDPAEAGLRIALLEPYYGGSHAQFVDTLVRHSRHRYTLATMPARKWKWRMRGSGVHLTRDRTAWIESAPAGGYDMILCSDMLPVGDLRALLPPDMRRTPIACYFHENQLTYPVRYAETRDFHFAMTNIVSCLAADAVWFNSRYHLEAFLDAAKAMLVRMPDHVPKSVLDEIAGKSCVLSPPVLVEPLRRSADPACEARPPTILWSHRWEYDKNPAVVLDALLALANEGLSFRLVMLGERFETVPPEFAPALERLGSRVVHAGWLEHRDRYLEMLRTCDVVVSAAIQENFGYAVIEAVLCGCQPLLPHRLAYPEVIDRAFHTVCLYDNDGCFQEALRDVMTGRRRLADGELAALQNTLERRYGRAALHALDEAMAKLARVSSA